MPRRFARPARTGPGTSGAGVACPTVRALRGHVLVMDFIGDGAAPPSLIFGGLSGGSLGGASNSYAGTLVGYGRGFGNFVLRDKRQRQGRNPQTGAPILISPRRVLSFKASQILKQSLNRREAEPASKRG